MAGTQRPVRVAVLGGGAAGLTAAFYLTSPALRGRYEVTVYQQGWRLGGKGASGRNADAGQRIEEHGLHMFMGCYDNAFQMIRACYGEWQKKPDNPFTDWTRAFQRQPQISFAERVVENGVPVWRPWNLTARVREGTPGDPGSISMEDLLPEALRWIHDRHTELGVHRHKPLAHLLLWLVRILVKIPHPARRRPLLLGLLYRIFDRIARAVLPHALLGRLDHIELVLRLGYVVVRGFMADVLPYGVQGFDRINRFDFREWLMLHGARREDAWSPPIKSLYDMGFAYIGGDSANPEKSARTAAGVALKVLLLLSVGCRGAVLWKMNAGMGDTIFSPLYEVLRARGVRFEFFHRVRNLGLSKAGDLVERIELTRQVDLVSGEYDPLVPVRGLPCWPSEPLWKQIVDGEAIRERLAKQQLTLESFWCDEQSKSQPQRVLEHGRDFDQVVCGISLAGLEYVCGELIGGNDDWKRMVRCIETVQTQALQLWLEPDLKGLGWTAGPTVLVSYTEPFDSWGEMSHLLAMEEWKGDPAPGSVEYFCGALKQDGPIPSRDDKGFPARARTTVLNNAEQWLGSQIEPLWPGAVASKGSGLDWSLLLDRSGANGAARLRSQYWRANVDPTERYVLSAPGTIQYRMQAGRSGFSNLFLAGDWVVTGLNAGAFEAAVEGGMRAARAMCGLPAEIHGLDH